jgi:hypothetical protein
MKKPKDAKPPAKSHYQRYRERKAKHGGVAISQAAWQSYRVLGLKAP